MRYRVKESFKPRCCDNYFDIGQILEIVRQTSKNRLTVNAYEYHLVKGYFIRGSHNVKRSTFFRCCEELNEN